MTQTIHYTDQELQNNVTEELQYDPSTQADRVVVTANSGTVTLTGETMSLPQKLAAKRSTMRVRGVTAIIDKMTVLNPGTSGTSDADLMDAARKVLDWTADVPAKSIKTSVQDHVITLSGSVAWDYQRDAAVRAVSNLRGVTAVMNSIILDQPSSTAPSMNKVESAIRRCASLDPKSIHVDVKDHEVFLQGNVRSFAEFRQAEHIAWAAPGVTKVTNKLLIGS
jgi:osmotically-inducible protein OsmY